MSLDKMEMEQGEVEKQYLMNDELTKPTRSVAEPWHRNRLCNRLLLAYSIFSTLAFAALLSTFFTWHVDPVTTVFSYSATTEMSYARDQRYMSLDHQFDDMWDELGDLVQIPLVTTDYPSKEVVPATISMLHQLHCLSSLRKALQQSYDGGDIGIDWRDNNHWPHCLDYLRMTILCFADTTVEKPEMKNGTRAHFIDGSHDARSCGSVDSVYELMESLREKD